MNTEPEPDFDYQAYMKGLPPQGVKGDPIRVHRGPRARQERREAAKKRLSPNDITTVAQFHARLGELDVGKRPFLFRGQSDSHHPVNCSAVRRLTGFATNPIETQLIDNLLVGYLEYLIGKARRRGFVPSNIGESAADLADLELLALLQHQGAATGLIDFTRQPLAALWFACNGSNAADGVVYILPQSEVTEIKHRSALEQELQSFYGENKLWSWEPPLLGNRIVAQSSVFVFGISAIPLHKMEICTIPVVSKSNILGELETVYDINEEELFPDFAGYAVANSSTKTFAVSRTVDYWKEQIDSESNDVRTARAHFLCGVANSAIQNHEEAVKNYDKAIWASPQYTDAFINRGATKSKLGQHEEAMADYDKALSIDSQDAAVYINRAATKHDLGWYQEAIEDCNEAIHIDAQSALAYNNRGAARAALCQYEEAITDYNEALRIDPQYASAYAGRGNAKSTLGHYEEAIADYDEAIYIDSQYALAYHNRGYAKHELKRYEDAIADYDQEIRLNPQDAEAYADRANAKASLGRHQEAIADYDRALWIDPQYAEASNNREIAKAKLRSSTQA